MDGDEYRASLEDGRRVFFDGRVVASVVEHPRFRGPIDWVARGYTDAQNLGSSDAYKIPRSAADLRAGMEAMAEWERSIVLTMEARLALHTAGARMPDGEPYDSYRHRIDAFAEHVREHDLRCVLTITDAKGDRALPPGKQTDPDLYLRVTEHRPDGIVINGAKLHITGAAIAHEMIVIPERRMKPGEEQWAVACAVPVNAPGVTILNSIADTPMEDSAYHPISAGRGDIVGFVVLDNVFVPNDRVFLCGEVDFSATFAHALGLWNRIGGAMHVADRADELVGMARLLAEANGIERIPHIKDKLTEMVLYATLVRAGVEAAIENAVITPEGFATPNELYTNAAKYYSSYNLSRMISYIWDIAGGGLMTAPLPGDLENPETRLYVEKYMRTREGISGDYRTRLFHAARDLTATAAAGNWQFGTIMGGGGLHAQKIVINKHYDMQRATAMARHLAHLD